MKTPHATLPRLIILLTGLGLVTLLGGCGLFNSGPNVIHVGSGLQWDANQLGRPATAGQTAAASVPTSQLTEANPATGQGG
jgi:hypothetical protein